MKIIELLIRIANKEEIPKKIEYSNKIWKLEEHSGDYKNEDTYLFEYLFKHFNTKFFINDKAEMIEEPKKIKYPILHKTAPSETTGYQMPNWRNLIDCNFEYLNKTICQLIDEINNLKEND